MDHSNQTKIHKTLWKILETQNTWTEKQRTINLWIKWFLWHQILKFYFTVPFVFLLNGLKTFECVVFKFDLNISSLVLSIWRVTSAFSLDFSREVIALKQSILLKELIFSWIADISLVKKDLSDRLQLTYAFKISVANRGEICRGFFSRKKEMNLWTIGCWIEQFWDKHMTNQFTLSRSTIEVLIVRLCSFSRSIFSKRVRMPIHS